ncbi:hypothetical protein AKJ56_02440 [candidate division MSBL1 archaeon SCGC-AAA382N08]|uniref:Glutamate synthase alpha subunit C-terminal domain-containing protein n=1 Tax=candidate division MSBL1 archaeon SCGC-AAA382N08 TaxID=1698285 RepID=A0A133VMI8_9EURY|nr:hypothetical protein AKJ56_02440 [candidate division MSBL1 archaeon SCGC-AAA382N08]
MMKINAEGVYYKDLNERIRKAVDSGESEIILENVNGQRYIGTNLRGSEVNIEINGVPGNDLAAFMDGPNINVRSNSQDAVGNTMNSGKVVVHGNAGDLVGHSMRGGKIYIRGDVGYRTGIHMKAYRDLFPVLIAGGTARDFLGEYMAGGLLVVLGLDGQDEIAGDYIGTGMHGGEIYLRGEVEGYQFGKEVGVKEPDDEDMEKLVKYLNDYAEEFGLDLDAILEKDFTRLVPSTHRPYGTIYAY